MWNLKALVKGTTNSYLVAWWKYEAGNEMLKPKEQEEDVIVLLSSVRYRL